MKKRKAVQGGLTRWSIQNKKKQNDSSHRSTCRGVILFAWPYSNLYPAGWLGKFFWLAGIWYSPVQGTFFFRGVFKEVFTFPTIFSFLRVVWSRFFYQRIALSLDNVLNTQNMLIKRFFELVQRSKSKNLRKIWSKAVILRRFHILYLNQFFEEVITSPTTFLLLLVVWSRFFTSVQL